MIRVYVTTKNGEGYTESMKFDDLEDVKLRIAMFREDVVLTFAEECDKHENSYPCELCREEQERSKNGDRIQ